MNFSGYLNRKTNPILAGKSRSNTNVLNLVNVNTQNFNTGSLNQKSGEGLSGIAEEKKK